VQPAGAYGGVEDVGGDGVEEDFGAAEHREGAGVVDGARREVDEPAAGAPL
jgi:hypothetical protein